MAERDRKKPAGAAAQPGLSRDQIRELTGKCAQLLRRAVLTMNALPDVDRRYLRGPRCSLPTPVRDVGLAYGSEGAIAETARAARFTPTPADVERCLQVLSWLRWLEQQGDDGRRGARIIVARAFGRPIWKIATKLDKQRSDETVRRWEAAAIESIALRFRADIEAMK